MTFLVDRRRARHELLVQAVHEHDLRRQFRNAAIGSGLARTVDSVAGSSLVTPRVLSVTPGPPMRLQVQLLAGQLPEDVQAVGHRLGPALGAVMVRVVPTGDLTVSLELLDRDPLAQLVPFEAVEGRVVLGRDEHGRDVAVSWSEMPHLIIQGATRSGKSWAAYSLLAQAAGDRAVLVAGLDPSGLLLRPFSGTRHEEWQVRGLRDVEAHVSLLARLVEVMDGRIEALPIDRDVCELGPDQPVIITVLEEYPGLLAAADAEDAKLGKRLRGLVGRLCCEGHKGGVRLLLVAQRAEANVVNGLVRAQCEGKISFRVDNLDSIKLLHPDAGPEVTARHITAPSGVALLSMPGYPLRRMRSPAIGGYSDYSALVRSACQAP